MCECAWEKFSCICMNIWLEAMPRTQIVKRWLEFQHSPQLTTTIVYSNQSFLFIVSSLSLPPHLFYFLFLQLYLVLIWPEIFGSSDFLGRRKIINNSMGFVVFQDFYCKKISVLLHWTLSMALKCKWHTLYRVFVCQYLIHHLSFRTVSALMWCCFEKLWQKIA